MDPLSITLAVLSLLKTCSDVYTALKDLHDAGASADARVSTLMTEVATFSQVIQLMKDTLEHNQIRSSVQSTGHIGSHWNNLATLLLDCQTVLVKLQETLEGVNKSVVLLDGTRKHFRLKSASQEIEFYQQQIRSYRDTLQLSLQTVILWNQVTFRESTDQILPNLDELYKAIRTVAADINSRMINLENTIDVLSTEPQLSKLSNLRNCVRSAADIVSSASTTLGVAPERIGSSYGSDFGDCFPPQQSEAMQRWISSNTVYDFEQQDSGTVVAGKAKVSPTSSLTAIEEVKGQEQSDSDSDIEIEIAQSLLRRGKQKIDLKDHESAERLLRNCFNRISQSGSAISLRRTSKLQSEAKQLLLSSYLHQGKWEEAQTLLMSNIAAVSHDRDSQPVLADMLVLVEVLLQRKAYAEALLYGRRALKGYRKLGPAGVNGVKQVLELIIKVCNADGSYDDEDAYTAILSDFRDKMKRDEVLDASAAPNHEQQGPSDLKPQMSLSDSNLSSTVHAAGTEDVLNNGIVENTASLEKTLSEVVPALGTVDDVHFCPPPSFSSGSKLLPYPDSEEDEDPAAEKLKKATPVVKILDISQSDLPILDSSSRALRPVDRLSRPRSPNALAQVLGNDHEAMQHSSSKGILPSATSQFPTALSKPMSHVTSHSNNSTSEGLDASPQIELGASQTASPTFDDLLSPTVDDLLAPVITTKMSTRRRKVVIVGDSTCGKTTLLVLLTKGVFMQINTPTVCERFSAEVQIDRTHFGIDFEDTAGMTDYDQFRPAAYSNTQLVLICFAIDWPNSFANVLEKWKPEVLQFCTGIPYMLVGLKTDLRDDPLRVEELKTVSQHPVTREEAIPTASEMGASCYMECSAKTGEGVKEIFAAAARLALSQKTKAEKARDKSSFRRLGKALGMISH